MLKEKLFTRFDCFLDNPDAPEPEFEVVSVSITEALSTPYEIVLTVSSPKQHLNPRTFIKHSGSVILNFEHHKRYFHGMIGMFKQLHLITTPDSEILSLYEIRLYPQLWFLKFNKNYRIFQEKSTLDIVDELLKENKLLNMTFPKVRSTSVMEHVDPIRNYCVQYGESDFDFISRLLEDRGFYYYFDHSASKHRLKIAFTPHDHSFCPVVDTVEIRDTDFKGNELNKILTHEISTQMQPHHQVMIDYNYTTASIEMAPHKHSVGSGGAMYHYPGGYTNVSEGHTKIMHLVESDETEKITFAGASAAPFFSPGFKFTLSGHQNPLFDEKIFTLETVTHSIVDPRFVGKDDTIYTNTFTAFLSNSHYRPKLKTPKPKIHGTQTAIVIAPHGEEVWTDSQGRVKVQFHWNHRGYKTPVILNAEEPSHHQKKKHHEHDDENYEPESAHTRTLHKHTVSHSDDDDEYLPNDAYVMSDEE